jgi:hypothetical protein
MWNLVHRVMRMQIANLLDSMFSSTTRLLNCLKNHGRAKISKWQPQDQQRQPAVAHFCDLSTWCLELLDGQHGQRKRAVEDGRIMIF